MKIIIKETNEIKKLTIKDSNGIDWTADLITAGALPHDDDGTTILTNDEFIFWENYITKDSEINQQIIDLIDALSESEIPCPDKNSYWESYIKNKINENTDSDYNNHYGSAMEVINNIKKQYLCEKDDDNDKKITVKNNKYNLLSRMETLALYSNSAEKTDYLNDHPNMIACVYPQDYFIQYQIINPDDNQANIDNWDEDHIDAFDGLLVVSKNDADADKKDEVSAKIETIKKNNEIIEKYKQLSCEEIEEIESDEQFDQVFENGLNGIDPDDLSEEDSNLHRMYVIANWNDFAGLNTSDE